MLKTVSDNPETSLVFWSQNTNKSNLFEDRFGGDVLFLLPEYESLFRTIETELKTKKLSRFLPLWESVVKKTMTDVRKKLKKRVPEISIEQIERILNKFQGNAGEIFAEKFFRSGCGCDVCEPDSYEPVDPHNEAGIDASGISPKSGLEIGIQVKNYLNSEVGLDVFRTAGDESDKYSHTLSAGQFESFLACPNQYIFSFGKGRGEIVSEYENRVGFLGPDYIESKRFCGSAGDRRGNWTFFKDIADRISALKPAAV